VFSRNFYQTVSIISVQSALSLREMGRDGNCGQGECILPPNEAADSSDCSIVAPSTATSEFFFKIHQKHRFLCESACFFIH
jgi:hypothetical protein